MRISRPTLVAATIASLAGLGCGRATTSAAPTSGPRPITQVRPLTELFVLEMNGVPPEDTAATFPTGTAYRVILRHGAPDHAVFVELSFTDQTFPGQKADSVTVTLHPRPGVYGMDVMTSVAAGPGGRVRFKYPVHFAAPVAATARYGTAGRFEAALAVAIRMEDGSSYGLLVSERPAWDNLEAPFRGAGTYLVVAPR